jgi:hypothetical protein
MPEQVRCKAASHQSKHMNASLRCSGQQISYKLVTFNMVHSSKALERRMRAQRAKDFLISQLVEEAQRENVSLSEVERKMLYFTETKEPSPDIYEVNAQFESEYDSAEYEEKIAGLLRNAFRRNQKESVEVKHQWKQAVVDLRKEDHYLLVMIDQSLQPPSDFWTVAKWSSVLVVCSLVAVTLWEYAYGKGWIPSWVSNLSEACDLRRGRRLVCVQARKAGCSENWSSGIYRAPAICRFDS